MFMLLRLTFFYTHYTCVEKFKLNLNQRRDSNQQRYIFHVMESIHITI